MGWFTLILRLIPAIVSLMGVAEKALGEPESGAEKKALVKEGAKAMVNGVIDVSTGGQEETWKKVESVVDPIIDIAARFIFWKD